MHFYKIALLKLPYSKEIAKRRHIINNRKYQYNMPLNIHSEEFLKRLIRRQLRLSISIALTFGVVLLGLPLLNYFAPDLMATRVGGFTLSWLVLGVLFFPLVWILSWFFIKSSTALEKKEIDLTRAKKPS